MPLMFCAFVFNLYATTEVQITRSLYLDLIKNVILNTIYEPAAYKETGSHWPQVAHTMIGKKEWRIFSSA